MILEQAIFTVNPGSEADFEAAVTQAREVIAEAGGFISFTLQRGIEEPSKYLFLAQWETVESHTEGFRGTDLHKRWRELIGPYFAADPQVEHFESPSVVK